MQSVSKTPRFDKLLDEILANLTPHSRVCRWAGLHIHCEGEFEISKGDIEFLKMLRVPAPNFCPTCRRIRRLTQKDSSRLFKRSCNVSNHNESMISIFPKECPFPVYDYKYFMGDSFDAFSFGLEYKDGASPLAILFALRKVFPMPSFLNKDPSTINSEYSNGGRNLKNGYYVTGCFFSENLWYCNSMNKVKDGMDSRVIDESDHVYGSVYSDHIYKSSFVYFSKDCTDSIFLFGCRNCDKCFGSVNLRNAKYCVWNKQLSEKEYKDFIKSIYPLSREKIKDMEDKFWLLVKSSPINASANTNIENCNGVLLRDAKNIFDATASKDTENVRHIDGSFFLNDSMDTLFSGGHSSLLYSTINTGNHSSNVKFSSHSKILLDCEFVFNCSNLINCFMCFGLRDKSYCILNKQYSAEEYYKLLDKIKYEMLKIGEYGDGLGMEFSAQAYNFSLSQIVFPLSEEQIIKLGGYIAEEPETNISNEQILTNADIPKYIDDVNDDIVEKAIECKVTGRPFRIIQSELQFLRKMKIPLPDTHPMIRMQEELAMFLTAKKYQTSCKKCNKKIESVFNLEEGYNMLYCEDCYKKEVY